MQRKKVGHVVVLPALQQRLTVLWSDPNSVSHVQFATVRAVKLAGCVNCLPVTNGINSELPTATFVHA